MTRSLTAGNGVPGITDSPSDWTARATRPVRSEMWHADAVAGAGAAISAPSLVSSLASADICVVGPRDSLKFYFSAGNRWSVEQVAPPGSVQ
jgi:hypothetical protein